MKTGFNKSRLPLVNNDKEIDLKNDVGNFHELRACMCPTPRRFNWVLLLILGFWVMTMIVLAENEFRYRYVSLNEALLPAGVPFFFNPAKVNDRGIQRVLSGSKPGNAIKPNEAAAP